MTNGPMSIIEQVHAELKKLDADLLERAKKGESLTIMLPGMGTAAAVVLATLHGITGHWPNVRYPVRTEQGFTWPEEAVIDLNNVRLNCRTWRA